MGRVVRSEFVNVCARMCVHARVNVIRFFNDNVLIAARKLGKGKVGRVTR